MIRFFVISLLIPFFLMDTAAQDRPAYLIYNQKGKKVKFKKMIKDLVTAEVVLFGETHNSSIIHWLQQEVLQDLYTMKGDKLVLALEMIERHDQAHLDNYLAGELNEEQFEEQAELWGNYATDYKPMVVFAKEKKLPVIASNITRKYASMVFKQGIESLDTLSQEAQQYMMPLPVEIDLSLPGYQDMMGMMDETHVGRENFPKAQAVKDATMAYSIIQNLVPNGIVYHLNGAFHSDNFDGINWYIKHYKKGVSVQTISTVHQKDISKLEDENTGKAHYIICVPENMTRTY